MWGRESDPLLGYEPKPWFYVRIWRYVTDLLSSQGVLPCCLRVDNLITLATSIMSAIWVDQYFGHQYNKGLEQTKNRAINDAGIRNYTLGESKGRCFSGENGHAFAGFVQFLLSAGTRGLSFSLMVYATSMRNVKFSARVKFSLLSLGLSALEFTLLYFNLVAGFYSNVGKDDGRSMEVYDWFYMLNCDHARYGTNKTFHSGDPACVSYCYPLQSWDGYKNNPDEKPYYTSIEALEKICNGSVCEGLSFSSCNDQFRRKEMPFHNNFTPSVFDNPPSSKLFFYAGTAFIIAAPVCGAMLGLAGLIYQRKEDMKRLLQQRQNGPPAQNTERQAFENILGAKMTP